MICSQHEAQWPFCLASIILPLKQKHTIKLKLLETIKSSSRYIPEFLYLIIYFYHKLSSRSNIIWHCSYSTVIQVLLKQYHEKLSYTVRWKSIRKFALHEGKLLDSIGIAEVQKFLGRQGISDIVRKPKIHERWSRICYTLKRWSKIQVEEIMEELVKARSRKNGHP